MSSLAIVGVALLLMLQIQFRNYMNTQITSLQATSALTDVRISYLEQKHVDLTVKSFQNVGGNFVISIESVDAHLTGITLKGSVLNQNATRCSDVKFSVTVGNSKQELGIPSIPSGYASKFELYIPDVSTQDTKTASIEYESSNISYGINQ